MSLNGWLQISLFIAVVLLLAKPMGSYITCVFEQRRTLLDAVLVPCERLLYRITGVDAREEMRWTQYATAMLLFSAATLILTYIIQRVQQFLPLNPQHLAAVAPDLALNTAISFTTNTNWQAYTPETTMSYLTQMLGLATHMFWSAATGLALAVAFIRGIARREQKTLGNFWVDLTRGTLWILLPISVVFALALVSQGVIQNLKPYTTARLLEAQHVTTTGSDGKTATSLVTTQTIAQGPVASQEAIKMLGTNGGGFFNANSAHPFENPTPLLISSRCLRSFLYPRVWPLRWDKWWDRRSMVGRARSHGCVVVRGHPDMLLGRVATKSVAARCGSAGLPHPVWRKHGGQGGALRRRQLRTVRHGHNGRKLRCCEQHA